MVLETFSILIFLYFILANIVIVSNNVIVNSRSFLLLAPASGDRATTPYVQAQNKVTLPHYLTLPYLALAKTRVAPLAARSEPRLEMMAAILRLRLTVSVSRVVHWVEQSSGLFDHVLYPHAFPTKVTGFSLVGPKRHCLGFNFFLSVCKV